MTATQGILHINPGADAQAGNLGWFDGHMISDSLFAAYFYGSDEPASPADPTYDYSLNDRSLTDNTSVVTAAALSAGVSSYLIAPFSSASLLARTSGCTVVSFQKAIANVLSAGTANYGSTNPSNYASVLLGMATGTNTPYEAMQRNAANSASTIKIPSDANTGAVYEMIAATFSTTAPPTLYRRCVALDGTTQIRQTATGLISNINPSGPSLFRVGRSLDDGWAGNCSVLGTLFYDQILSFTDLDTIYAAEKAHFAAWLGVTI